MTQIITNSLPIGNPGDIARNGNFTTEPQLQHGTYPVTAYGLPVRLDSGALKGITAADLPANIIGFLVRAFPSLAGVATVEALGTATPPVAPAVLSLLKRGYLFVKKLNGTPAKGGKVYVRTAATDGVRLQGGIECAAAQTVAGGTITGTGTGTIAATADGTAKPGTYRITLLATSQTAAVSVIDPDGNRLKDGVVGTEYTAQGLTFTITAAGTMTSGDYFAPVVSNTTIEIPGAYFTGAADADGVAEVAYNL